MPRRRITIEAEEEESGEDRRIRRAVLTTVLRLQPGVGGVSIYSIIKETVCQSIACLLVCDRAGKKLWIP